MSDYRLLAVETLNDEAVLLRERIVDLEGERDVYRELLSDTLDQLHVALDRDERHRDHIARLVDENRRLRASVTGEAA